MTMLFIALFFNIVEPSSMCLLSPQFLIIDQIIFNETNITQQLL
jgi:hypothetical protein